MFRKYNRDGRKALDIISKNPYSPTAHKQDE